MGSTLHKALLHASLTQCILRAVGPLASDAVLGSLVKSICAQLGGNGVVNRLERR